MSGEVKRILFVDDEVGVLLGLERMLFDMSDAWDMTFVESGEEALSELSEDAYDVIVSDMRMPKMDGATLLSRVHKDYPYVARIILTGHSELEATLRAMPVAHSFLTKPCDPDLLQDVVRRTCNLQALLQDGQLRTMVGGVAQLPTRPEVYSELTEALSEPDADMLRIASIVRRDVGLSAKVLHLTNSAFFGAGRKFIDVNQAVAFIGMRMLRKVVLSAEVFSKFSTTRSLGGLSLENEQKHGLACAGVARKIAPDAETGEYAFLAGMLHDVGKLVLASRSPKTTRKLNKERVAFHSLLPEGELAIANTDHGRIGAYLLGLWGIEYPVVEAVAYHHDPGAVGSDRFELPSILHVADALVHEMEAERAGVDMEVQVDREHLEKLGVLDRLDEWRQEARALCAKENDDS